MSGTLSAAGGIVVVFSRPSDFTQQQAWSTWCDDTLLPATRDASGARVATRWENTEQIPMAAPPVGFTHLAVYEFDDIATGAPRLLDLFDRSSAATGPQHPAHTIIGVEVMRPAGSQWSRRLDSSSDVTGQVIAFVGPNDPAREDEWNVWLDTVHVPDMVNSGACSALASPLRQTRAN